MAHFFCNVREPNLPVFFNVDGVVGAGPASNKREDVLLVQFFLKIVAEKIRTENLTPAEVNLVKSIQVTGNCDQTTVDIIYLSQRLRKKNVAAVVADGRVSPAKPGGVIYARDSLWTIVTINWRVKDLTADVWPRIDKVAGCPPELGQMVARTLIGNTNAG